MSTPTSTTPPTHCAVIGAGLVGTLCAAMLSSRGYTVDLYDARSDPRLSPIAIAARSINLALSPRGIEALRSVNEELVERVLADSLPMRGRMLHHKPGKEGGETRTEGQDYGVVEEGECINSISRTGLGIALLDHLDGLPREGRGSVRTHFNTKLVEMDMRKEKGVSVTLGTKEGSSKVDFDFVIGADGAYNLTSSKVTLATPTSSSPSLPDPIQHSQSVQTISTSGPAENSCSSLSPTSFVPLLPPSSRTVIREANSRPHPSLHQDKSFTLTLFAPQEQFDSIDALIAEGKTPNPVVELFEKEFPDALKLMGEEQLLKDWRDNPKDGLITIECSPYHFKDKALLIGDASHGMVPFYGTILPIYLHANPDPVTSHQAKE
ncbi:hypothetical protein P7C70_g9248, partial [Phenoliferia sp. Uapishka_3]